VQELDGPELVGRDRPDQKAECERDQGEALAGDDLEVEALGRWGGGRMLESDISNAVRIPPCWDGIQPE
jgi:hypothetical protein